ncbi:hypothetical protein FA04_13920 [Ensifer adhaerens]|uniref:Uncharacterized protein n=1 Tax=Ensifer adhaerens TaxID=106592 RepID=A0ABY8HD58_ENSAD|nr:hypothetical protein [Ensifer adhaerens]ANK73620.1 hypothetical protein FA04_13920 [Ensifer adhaerens]KDP73647.1 hypothetical protein FA04_11120 [Ensifer adhaerens]WFP89696.1 hypothetical protein P4B07_14145 [Ensifer adhaerens]
MDIRPSDRTMRWLGPAVVFAVFAFVIFGSPPMRAGVCTGAADEHCVRDWISATSGWFAGVAAFISIYLLSQQVRDARNAYNAAEQKQVDTKRRLAQRMRELIVRLSSVMNRVRRVPDDYQSESFTKRARAYEIALELLTEELANPVLDELEEQFELGTHTIAWVRRPPQKILEAVRAAVRAAEVDEARAAAEEALLTSLIQNLTGVDEYCRKILRQCDRVLQTHPATEDRTIRSE